jgi:alkylated DNA repair dioxygenase AlkB
MTATLPFRSTVLPSTNERASIPQAGYRHFPSYLADTTADVLLGWLRESVDWRSERIRILGKSVAVPRLVAWYGDPGVCYRYSGVEHVAGGWPSQLCSVRDLLRREWSAGFNFVLINRYRDGSDSMGWHRDDEPELAGPIASLSLGATRRLRVRVEGGTGSIALDLSHGALLCHERHLPHALMKTRRPVGERINLSFRTVVSR